MKFERHGKVGRSVHPALPIRSRRLAIVLWLDLALYFCALHKHTIVTLITHHHSLTQYYNPSFIFTARENHGICHARTNKQKAPHCGCSRK
ncbi:hypothetical protein Hanom_Chr11g01038561 [Helianthus anomalus]